MQQHRPFLILRLRYCAPFVPDGTGVGSALSDDPTMHPLYQQLKEFDPDTFQRLCAQLLMARYPGGSVHVVDGPGGDQGVDIFMGNLEEGPGLAGT